MTERKNWIHRPLVGLLGLLTLVLSTHHLNGQEPNSIWSPRVDVSDSGESYGECYFRKKFSLIRPEQAEVLFAANDEYAIYLNGREVARGQSFGETTRTDVTPYVVPGVNLIAVYARHINSEVPGVAVRFRVKERNETRWRSLVSDGSWKTRTQFSEDWQRPGFNDLVWLPAQTVVLDTSTKPQMNAANRIASTERSASAEPNTPKRDLAASANRPQSIESEPTTNDDSSVAARRQPSIPGDVSETVETSKTPQTDVSTRQTTKTNSVDSTSRVATRQNH